MRRRLASTTPALPLCVLAPLAVACGGSTPPAETAPAPSASVAAAPPPPPASTGPVKPAYPQATKSPVVDLYRDVKVTDDYRWLEDWKDPKVKEWSEAENAFARQWLDGSPQRAAIHARVADLLNDTSPSWSDLAVQKGVVLALEHRPPKQHPTLVVLASLDDAKGARALVDPDAIDSSGGTSISWFVPTLDGKKVAVSLAKGGAERGDVHVFDVASGKEAKDVVPQADGAGSGNCLAWKADGSGFYYTHAAREADAPKDGVYQRIYFHKLGDPTDKDALAVGKDSPRIAQWELGSSPDGKSVIARMEYGDGGEYEQWLLAPGGTWKHLATKDDGVKEMKVGADGLLYLRSTKGASRGKLLRTSVAAPSLEKAEVVSPEGEAVLSDFYPLKTQVYLLEIVGGPSQIRTLPLGKTAEAKPGADRNAAKAATLVPTPPVSAVREVVPVGGDDVAFESVSFTDPPGWYRVKAGAVSKTALVSTSKADFAGVAVTREECTSKDGTKVPVTILRPKAAPQDGSAPALLTGYGGFGISTTPRFRPVLQAWLEQGGIYASANIRGGGEKGEAWHTAGNLTNKQNVYDDFYGCAQHLVEAKYTTPARLAIQGGSNGGLLMGAELTQHPEEFKAVVSSVGIYDMLRVERDSNGAFNVTEYGSVTDPKQFDALYAYSPYHHVKDGVAYPATLFLTGANDPRVAPYHSRKMVARLQAATSSDAPILLRTSANTGHGQGSPLAAVIEEQTDIFTFLVRELGINYTPAK